MKQKLLIVGDSCTYGHGCSDRVYYWDDNEKKYIGTLFKYPNDPPSRFAWPSLLQNDLVDYEILNISMPGNANQHMFASILDYIKNEKNIVLILFCGSFADRIQIANMGDPNKIDPWVISWNPPLYSLDNYYNTAKDYYRKYLYNNEIGLNQTLSALFAAYSICLINNIKFMWSIPDFILKPIHKEICLPIRNLSFTSMIHYDYSGINSKKFNSACRCVDWHPNDKGHKIYYEKEIYPKILKKLNE